MISRCHGNVAACDTAHTCADTHSLAIDTMDCIILQYPVNCIGVDVSSWNQLSKIEEARIVNEVPVWGWFRAATVSSGIAYIDYNGFHYF